MNLDTGKTLAREVEQGFTLGCNNLISSKRGLNGLVFDIQGLVATNLTTDDFVFQMSPQGIYNESTNPPSSWAVAPAPTQIDVVPAAGSTPARVILGWADNVIQDRWLRVTVKSTANTGLFSDQRFYAGHLRGEVTGARIRAYPGTEQFTAVVNRHPSVSSVPNESPPAYAVALWNLCFAQDDGNVVLRPLTRLLLP